MSRRSFGMAKARNPYAPPAQDDLEPERVRDDAQDDDEDRAHRDGELLRLVRFGGRLPKRCVVCNASAREHQITQKLYWHPQWIYVLIAVSPIIYAIIAMITRKDASVEVPLCGDHVRRRRNGQVLVWGGLLVGLVLIFGAAFASAPAGIFLGVVALFGAIIAGSFMMRTVMPAKMDERYVWLKVNALFLNSIKRSV